MENEAVMPIRANAGGYEACMASAVMGIETLIAAINKRTEELKTSPPEDWTSNDTLSVLRELNKAVLVAVEQKGRVDDVLRQERGGDGLDFNAARAEIGRRLASIRKAAGEGELSEGADG